MTPFELDLKNQLDIEWQRFANDWLFPWHNINIPNRVVNVEDYRGGKFAVGGIVFEGQIRTSYWQAIIRYLMAKIHEVFRIWDEETKAYPNRERGSSLKGTSVLLKGFVATIIQRAVETDRALRGRGTPQNASPYNTHHEFSEANGEILRLTDSHMALLENNNPVLRPSPAQWIEAFGTRYRGTIALLALAVALLFGLWKVFGG